MKRTKKIALLIVLSALAVVASVCFYAFLSYAITYSPMNSFMTLEESIISCIVSGVVLLGLSVTIVVVSTRKMVK